MKPTRAAVTRLVIDCENTLGWQPPAGMPLTKARTRAVSVILRQFDERPDLTLRDLELAVALLSKKRMTLFSPAGLVHFVDEARTVGVSTDVELPLDAQVHAAKVWESEHELPGAGEWLTRLVRARGDFRADVIREWKTDRAAQLAAHPLVTA